MHIGFQRSGGRGEYEVVGSHSGYTAIGLEGWTFHLRWPDGIVRETGLELEPATSGKPRLRSLWSPKFQIGRMVAAMLMLPDPRREYAQTTQGFPVARSKGYVLSRLGFGPDTEFTGISDMVTVDPSFIELANLDERESIGVQQRWARIEKIYARIERLPGAVHEQVEKHRVYLASGDAVDATLTSIVSALLKELALVESGWEPDTDPLPWLERMLDIAAPLGPSLPPPDELGEDEPLVSARSAHEYRLAKMRGSAGRKFSTDIRHAYANRCAFCGAEYGGVPGVRSGVDAAHILAWSKYDLDVIPNGLSLCKLHHWAFDAALLVPVYEGTDVVLAFTELSNRFESETLARLGQNGFVLPADWLPQDKKHWPSAKYLDLLYADLAISFSA